MAELYLGIRGNMNVMRSKLVSKVFDHTLTTDENSKDGTISLQHIKEAYSSDWMPDVQVRAIQHQVPPLTIISSIAWVCLMLTNLAHAPKSMTIPPIQVWQSTI